jgi:hypothetical protein
MLARYLLVTVGVFTVFLSVLEGFHRAVSEVGGIALANHTLYFCPNWLLGMATGGLAVGLAWWTVGLVKRDR